MRAGSTSSNRRAASETAGASRSISAGQTLGRAGCVRPTVIDFDLYREEPGEACEDQPTSPPSGPAHRGGSRLRRRGSVGPPARLPALSPLAATTAPGWGNPSARAFRQSTGQHRQAPPAGVPDAMMKRRTTKSQGRLCGRLTSSPPGRREAVTVESPQATSSPTTAAGRTHTAATSPAGSRTTREIEERIDHPT